MYFSYKGEIEPQCNVAKIKWKYFKKKGGKRIKAEKFFSINKNTWADNYSRVHTAFCPVRWDRLQHTCDPGKSSTFPSCLIITLLFPQMATTSVISIHRFSISLHFGMLECIPAPPRERDGRTPTNCRSHVDKETFTHTFTPKDNEQSWFNNVKCLVKSEQYHIEKSSPCHDVDCAGIANIVASMHMRVPRLAHC